MNVAEKLSEAARLLEQANCLMNAALVFEWDEVLTDMLNGLDVAASTYE